MQHVATVLEAGRNAAESLRVTQAEAARALGLNRSTVKRYLDQYPELLQTGGVEIEALRRHRNDNPRVAGFPQRPLPFASEASEADGIEARPSAKRRLEEARARQAEIELAQIERRLVDPASLLDGAADAAILLRDRLLSPDLVLCERLAQIRDPREVKAVLKQFLSTVLESASTALMAAAGASDG